MIDINRRSFFDHEYGPIIPGFTGTLKIPIQLHGIKAEKIHCSKNAK